MNEGRVLAVVTKPRISREVADNGEGEVSKVHWRLIDLHEEHGGSPAIEGVVTIDTTLASRKIPRYKVVFPDGFIDYIKVDIFDDYYDMVPEILLK